MRKTVAAVLATGVILALGTNPSATAHEEPPPDKWTQVADQAYAEAVEAFGQAKARGMYVRAQLVAPLANYAGRRFGWQDPRTQAWLDELYTKLTPTKGYGVGVAWDPYSDGTTNPASTAYTITGAWHVGATLLAGYDGGGIPASRVQEVANWMMRIPEAGGGRCASYSEHRNDAGKPCVWNVSITAAWFIWRVYQRHLFPASQEAAVLARLRAWRDRVRANYRYDLRSWTYCAGCSGSQGPWYNAATVRAMYEADPTLGVRALNDHFSLWPVHGANLELIPVACNRGDANFEAIREVMTRPAPDPVAMVAGRAGWAAGTLTIAQTCA